MAKFKPVRQFKTPASGPPRPGAVPCVLIIVAAFALLALLFYGVLAGSGS